jgi:serine/threonine protein kinase
MMPMNTLGQINIIVPESPQRARDYSIQFRDALLPDITHIDELIRVYNQLSTEQEKIDALIVLEKAIDQMDRKYPDDLKRYFPDYHKKIHHDLFKAIQHERAELNVLPDESNLSFPEYLAIMAPNKVEKMLEILLAPDFTQEKLADHVFKPDEKGYDAYRAMLSRYEIGVLGGGNSKNFTVRDLHMGQTLVLKAENRMGVPKDAVQHLRAQSMYEVFTQDISEREAMFMHPVTKEPATRTLLFTEYHPGGSLVQQAKENMTPEERGARARYVYLQMARILEKIEQDGCCFTDMKNSNWLVDRWGELRIADKKAFLYIHDSEVEVLDAWGDASIQTIRVLDPAYDKNKFYSPARTMHMQPPELASYDEHQKPIDVSKMHAYILGKNLYQYLTEGSDRAFFAYDKQLKNMGVVHDVNQFDFSSPVFTTPEGILLKRTIQQLVYTDPADAKMALHDAMIELALIEHPELFDFLTEHEAFVGLKVDAYLALKGMEFFKINHGDDFLMQAFIDKQKHAIDAASTEKDVLRVLSEIKGMVFMFRENHDQLQAIQDMIALFKADDASEAMKKKGAELEAAVLSVPVIERSSIADGKTKPQQAVLKAMGREVRLFERLSNTAVSMLHLPPKAPSEQMRKLTTFKEAFSKVMQIPNDSDAGHDVNVNRRPH